MRVARHCAASSTRIHRWTLGAPMFSKSIQGTATVVLSSGGDPMTAWSCDRSALEVNCARSVTAQPNITPHDRQQPRRTTSPIVFVHGLSGEGYATWSGLSGLSFPRCLTETQTSAIGRTGGRALRIEARAPRTAAACGLRTTAEERLPQVPRGRGSPNRRRTCIIRGTSFQYANGRTAVCPKREFRGSR